MSYAYMAKNDTGLFREVTWTHIFVINSATWQGQCLLYIHQWKMTRGHANFIRDPCVIYPMHVHSCGDRTDLWTSVWVNRIMVREPFGPWYYVHHGYSNHKIVFAESSLHASIWYTPSMQTINSAIFHHNWKCPTQAVTIPPDIKVTSVPLVTFLPPPL